MTLYILGLIGGVILGKLFFLLENFIFLFVKDFWSFIFLFLLIILLLSGLSFCELLINIWLLFKSIILFRKFEDRFDFVPELIVVVN